MNLNKYGGDDFKSFKDPYTKFETAEFGVRTPYDLSIRRSSQDQQQIIRNKRQLHGITVWELITAIIFVLFLASLVNVITHMYLLFTITLSVVCVGICCLWGRNLTTVLHLSLSLLFLFFLSTVCCSRIFDGLSGNLTHDFRFQGIYNSTPHENISLSRKLQQAVSLPESYASAPVPSALPKEETGSNSPHLGALIVGQTVFTGLAAIFLLLLLFHGWQYKQMPFFKSRPIDAQWNKLEFEGRTRLNFWQCFVAMLGITSILTVVHLVFAEFLAGIPLLALLIVGVVCWMFLKPDSRLFTTDSKYGAALHTQSQDMPSSLSTSVACVTCKRNKNSDNKFIKRQRRILIFLYLIVAIAAIICLSIRLVHLYSFPLPQSGFTERNPAHIRTLSELVSENSSTTLLTDKPEFFLDKTRIHQKDEKLHFYQTILNENSMIIINQTFPSDVDSRELSTADTLSETAGIKQEHSLSTLSSLYPDAAFSIPYFLIAAQIVTIIAFLMGIIFLLWDVTQSKTFSYLLKDSIIFTPKKNNYTQFKNDTFTDDNNAVPNHLRYLPSQQQQYTTNPPLPMFKSTRPSQYSKNNTNDCQLKQVDIQTKPLKRTSTGVNTSPYVSPTSRDSPCIPEEEHYNKNIQLMTMEDASSIQTNVPESNFLHEDLNVEANELNDIKNKLEEIESSRFISGEQTITTPAVSIVHYPTSSVSLSSYENGPSPYADNLNDCNDNPYCTSIVIDPLKQLQHFHLPQHPIICMDNNTDILLNDPLFKIWTPRENSRQNRPRLHPTYPQNDIFSSASLTQLMQSQMNNMTPNTSSVELYFSSGPDLIKKTPSFDLTIPSHHLEAFTRPTGYKTKGILNDFDVSRCLDSGLVEEYMSLGETEIQNQKVELRVPSIIRTVKRLNTELERHSEDIGSTHLGHENIFPFYFIKQPYTIDHLMFSSICPEKRQMLSNYSYMDTLGYSQDGSSNNSNNRFHVTISGTDDNLSDLQILNSYINDFVGPCQFVSSAIHCHNHAETSCAKSITGSQSLDDFENLSNIHSSRQDRNQDMPQSQKTTTDYPDVYLNNIPLNGSQEAIKDFISVPSDTFSAASNSSILSNQFSTELNQEVQLDSINQTVRIEPNIFECFPLGDSKNDHVRTDIHLNEVEQHLDPCETPFEKKNNPDKNTVSDHCSTTIQPLLANHLFYTDQIIPRQDDLFQEQIGISLSVSYDSIHSHSTDRLSGPNLEVCNEWPIIHHHTSEDNYTVKLLGEKDIETEKKTVEIPGASQTDEIKPISTFNTTIKTSYDKTQLGSKTRFRLGKQCSKHLKAIPHTYPHEHKKSGLHLKTISNGVIQEKVKKYIQKNNKACLNDSKQKKNLLLFSQKELETIKDQKLLQYLTEPISSISTMESKSSEWSIPTSHNMPTQHLLLNEDLDVSK